MATRILIAAARDTPPAAFRSAFPKLDRIELYEENGWTWGIASLWALEPSDLDPSRLDAPLLRISTADDALWFLQAYGPGREPFGIVHHHDMLPGDDAAADLLDSGDPDEDSAETFRETLVDLYELISPEFWPPAPVKELAPLSPLLGTAEYLQLQAEATVDALARLEIPHPRADLLACLTGEGSSEEERDDSLGSLPEFLACLGIDLYRADGLDRDGDDGDDDTDEEGSGAHDLTQSDLHTLGRPAPGMARQVFAAAGPAAPVALDAPVPLPLTHLHHAWLAAWACDNDAEIAFTIEGDATGLSWPRHPQPRDPNKPGRQNDDDAEELEVVLTPQRTEIALQWGSVWRREQWLKALGATLTALPPGTRLTLTVVDTTPADERDAPLIGPFLFQGTVADGSWQLTHVLPAMPAAALTESLALMSQVDRPGPVRARTPDEALAAIAAAERSGMFMQLPKLKTPTEVSADDDKHNLLAVFLRLRYAEHWPFDAVEASEQEQAEFTDQLRTLGQTFAQRAHPELAEAEVIFAGEFSRYLRPPPAPEVDHPLEALGDTFAESRERFLTEFLGEEAESATEDDDAPCDDPAVVAAALGALGFEPLGDLLCERFADVRLRAFARPGSTWAVHMQTFAGGMLEYYTELDDGSSLTCSTNPATADAPHKQIFRRSFPTASAAELLTQHEQQLEALAAQRGAEATAITPTLERLAQALDRFLLRELG